MGDVEWGRDRERERKRERGKEREGKGKREIGEGRVRQDRDRLYVMFTYSPAYILLLTYIPFPLAFFRKIT